MHLPWCDWTNRVVMMRLISNCGNKEWKMKRYEPKKRLLFASYFLETKAVNEYLASWNRWREISSSSFFLFLLWIFVVLVFVVSVLFSKRRVDIEWSHAKDNMRHFKPFWSNLDMLKILSEFRILFAVCFLSTLFLFLFDSAFSQPITTFPKLQKITTVSIERSLLSCVV